jgi:F-box protein 21
MASSPSVFPREFGDEILLQIFADVPPEDNLQSLQLVCRKFYNVGSDQTIWKRNCITSFRYWKDSRRFQNLVAGDKADVDWKEMWLARRRTNTRIGNLFDGILATKVGRLHRFRDICQFGYDAKDFLLEQLGTPDEADDVLARRWAFFSSFLLAIARFCPARNVLSRIRRPQGLHAQARRVTILIKDIC